MKKESMEEKKKGAEWFWCGAVTLPSFFPLLFPDICSVQPLLDVTGLELQARIDHMVSRCQIEALQQGEVKKAASPLLSSKTFYFFSTTTKATPT